MNLYQVEYYYDLGTNNYMSGHVTVEASSPEEARQSVASDTFSGSKLYVGEARRLDNFSIIPTKELV